jgi:hypothetical protein
VVVNLYIHEGPHGHWGWSVEPSFTIEHGTPDLLRKIKGAGFCAAYNGHWEDSLVAKGV